jgi:hypothetical protein
MRDRFLVLAAAVGIVAGAPERVAAHDLHAKVKHLPNAVVVEAGFDDDTPAEGAHVVIFDAGGTEQARGETDERGVLRLPMLAPGHYRAIVESIGHRDEVEFDVAKTEGVVEFANWRLDKRLGVAIGVGGLLLLTAAFWWLRGRKRDAGHPTSDRRPGSG